MNDLFQRENKVFQTKKFICTSTLCVGKDWAGPFFPPQNVLICLFIFQFMLLLNCISTLMNGLFRREDDVFKPTMLMVLLHHGVGKRLGGPILSPSKMFQSSHLSFSLMNYATHCILTLMNDLFQREYQVFKPTDLLVLLHCGVGKDWVNPLPPPPPPPRNVLTFPFIFHSFGLYFSFTVS